MTTLAETCAELATLTPFLAAALTRDNTPGTIGGVLTAGELVNPDVLHALVTLGREIPTATRHACHDVGEPWQPRPIPTCITALPRLEQRMRHLGHADAAAQLEQAARWWVRLTKGALGLRTPDLRLGVGCPACDGGGELLAAGSEGFLRRHDGVLTVEWEHAGRIYCPACGAGWGIAEWAHLGRVLQAAG